MKDYMMWLSDKMDLDSVTKGDPSRPKFLHLKKYNFQKNSMVLFRELVSFREQCKDYINEQSF